MKYAKEVVIDKLKEAVASNDVNVVLAIIVDQTTDIAVKNPKLLSDTLKKNGVSVSDSLDAKYLCNLVVDNLGNQELVKSIMYFIESPSLYLNSRGGGGGRGGGGRGGGGRGGGGGGGDFDWSGLAVAAAGMVGGIAGSAITAQGNRDVAREGTKQAQEARKADEAKAKSSGLSAIEQTKQSMYNMLGIKESQVGVVANAQSASEKAKHEADGIFAQHKTLIIGVCATAAVLGLGVFLWFKYSEDKLAKDIPIPQ